MKKQKRQHHLNNQQDNWCPEQRAHAVLQCGSHDNPWGNTRNIPQRHATTIESENKEFGNPTIKLSNTRQKQHSIPVIRWWHLNSLTICNKLCPSIFGARGWGEKLQVAGAKVCWIKHFQGSTNQSSWRYAKVSPNEAAAPSEANAGTDSAKASARHPSQYTIETPSKDQTSSKKKWKSLSRLSIYNHLR